MLKQKLNKISKSKFLKYSKLENKEGNSKINKQRILVALLLIASLSIQFSSNIAYKSIKDSELEKTVESNTEVTNVSVLGVHEKTIQFNDVSSYVKDAYTIAYENNMEIKAIVDADKAVLEEAARIDAFMYRYGSVMAGYGELITRKAYECGGNPRVLIGIAGKESGLGRIPYKLYNPYGYLNGVQYSSWEESLSILSCEISQRFLAPCNNDIYCVIRRYGGPDTDNDKWIRDVTWFINQI